MAQVSDDSALLVIIDEVIAQNAAVVDQIKSGKPNALGFLVGQAMKKSAGRANPKKLNELITRRISMFKKKWIVGVVVAFSLCVASVGISKAAARGAGDLYAKVELFSYALTTIQSEYVDQKSPQDLIYGALKGMLSSLDPHSQFMDPDEYKDLKIETQGKFGGLGIEITIKDNLLTVIAPIEDTPAWRAGIKAGDRIVKIGKDLTRDMSLDDAVKKLHGNPGTRVVITILRESEDLIRIFPLSVKLSMCRTLKTRISWKTILLMYA